MGSVRLRLASWDWLNNNGLILHYRGGDVRARHFVRPGGSVSVAEAAQILGTNDVQLHRLRRAGRLATGKARGRTVVPLTELLRIRRDPDALHLPRSFKTPKGRKVADA